MSASSSTLTPLQISGLGAERTSGRMLSDTPDTEATSPTLPPLEGVEKALNSARGQGGSIGKPVLRSPTPPPNLAETPETVASSKSTGVSEAPLPNHIAESSRAGEVKNDTADSNAMEEYGGPATSMSDPPSQAQSQKNVVSRGVISPESKFRKYWDMTQAIVLVYISLVVPFRVAYKISAEGPVYVWELAIDVYFYVDIVLNFYTGFYDLEDNRIIMNSMLIRNNYLRSWFAIDVLACLPIDLVYRIYDDSFICSTQPAGCDTDTKGDAAASAGQLLKVFKMLRLFRLMKLLRLVRLSRLFERYQDELFHYLYLLSVAKSAVFLMYLGHIFGCVFYYFSTKEWRSDEEQQQIEDGELSAWLYNTYNDSENKTDVDERYIASMYWAFTTMTTVGYGDISANTKTERIVAIVGMIMGGFVFSIIISTMHEVVQSANLSKRAHAQKMESVSAFIKDSKLPNTFTKSVLSFFRKQDTKAYDERALLQELPYELRHGILQHMYGDVIIRVPFFDVDGDGSVDDHVFVTELCSRIQPVMFTKGCLIFQKGEVGSHMFILKTGLVDIMNGTLLKVLTVLEPGSFFGEGAILGDTKRRENARARSLCELCKLERDSMEGMLYTYPHLRRSLVKTHKLRTGLFLVDDPAEYALMAKERAKNDAETDWDPNNDYERYDAAEWYQTHARSTLDDLKLITNPSQRRMEVPTTSTPSTSDQPTTPQKIKTANNHTQEDKKISTPADADALIMQEGTRLQIESLTRSVEVQKSEMLALHKKLDHIIAMIQEQSTSKSTDKKQI